MSKDPKTLENGVGDGGITRREFTNRAAALGATTALATTMSGLLPSEAVAATPKKGGHLRVGMAQGGPTDSLDPSTGAGEFIRMMRYSTMNQLVEVDHTGSAKPELAESWEPGSSAATWIFNIRKGVTWHDGKSLDANDVVGTLNTHRGTKSRSQIRSILKSVTSVKADTKHRVIFELKEPNVNFPFLMAAFQVRSIKDDKMYDFQNGTGTYVTKEFEPGIRVAFERNPNKWQEDRGWFDSAEMTPILDGGARNNALVTGEVDVIHRPDRRTWKRLHAINGLQVQKTSGKKNYTWPMHTDQVPFDNNDVRLAMKYAVDREELVDKVLNGTGSLGNDHSISPVYKYFNPEIPQRVYDPDKAKFHLKKAGVQNLTVKLSASEGIWDGAIDGAVLYSASAAKAGINIEVNKVPHDGYWSNIWNKHPFCAAYSSGRATEDWQFSVSFSDTSSWNDTKWKHPRFNELLKAARGEFDENKARDMYCEMQQIIHDDGGVVIPAFVDHLLAHSEKLGHGEIAGNWEMDGYRLIERWWFA